MALFAIFLVKLFMPFTSKKLRQKQQIKNINETINTNPVLTITYSKKWTPDVKQNATLVSAINFSYINKPAFLIFSFNTFFYNEKKTLSRLLILLPAFFKSKMAHYVNYAIDSHSFHVVRSAS